MSGQITNAAETLLMQRLRMRHSSKNRSIFHLRRSIQVVYSEESQTGWIDTSESGQPAAYTDRRRPGYGRNVDEKRRKTPWGPITKKFLDVFEDDANTRLDTFCSTITCGGDLIMQMDIEGAEWRTLLDASP
ncbi:MULTISPECIES: hypothetical protein [unclassified Aurantimonas]|uniref:hypothetical protein n=1 Tax=unclassified Aurantimonas TaxID=2638230 RepID=UPI002E16CABE|nr:MULTISPECIES: hypothetical protein [unclassified Aurantimonas]MEC5293428.1 hypothetical protein [Aurantimonas sp. C2-3-R2]MEC5414515.1 hypothetical protein [Aurantimonas sp. C2-4-R8]